MNRLMNVIALLLMLVLNGMANGLPLNGLTTGEVSAMYPNLFVPATITFGIWGLIYLLLLVYVASPWFARPGTPTSASPGLSWPFVVSCLANAAWIVAWHYRLELLSVLLILVLLTSLIVLYRRIGPSRAPWHLGVPISIYLGWVSVATIANITALLVYHAGPFNADIEVGSAVAMVVVATALAFYVLRIKRDGAFALVVAWALLGIWLRIGVDTSPIVQWTAIIGFLMLVMNAVATVAGVIMRSPPEPERRL